MDGALAEVGSPLGLQELGGHAFELALTAGSQVLALGTGGALLVEEAGDLQLVPEALGHTLAHLNALFHGHVHGGDEGDDVGGAHTGMLTLMLGHVDELSGLLGQQESALFHGGGGTDQGKDAAVVVAIGLDVDGGHTGDGVGNINQSLEGGLVLLLAAGEIGDAFNKLSHFVPPKGSISLSMCRVFVD